MNTRSRSTSSFTDGGPNKKAKTFESRLDTEISTLNECGVLNMQYGMIDDAQHFFVQALDCFTEKHRECTLIEADRRNGIGQNELLLQGSGIHQDVVASLKSPSLNDTLEYDEGVRAYIDTMDIGEGVSSSLQSAALYYNVAQTFVHLNKYNDAMSWFELALMCIKLVPECVTVFTTIVKIRHNLGYCYYRLAKINEAKYCFEKALDLAKKENES